ncbi:MAG: GGDEF domain-containing protein, partial [Spirochaetota bacterium]
AVLICFPEEGKSFEDVLKLYPSHSAKILHHLLVMVAWRLRVSNALIKENSPVMQELKKQVYLDKMTGIYNKTYMEEKLNALFSARPASLSYLSIKPDNFKEINDTYGHEAGDEAIRIFARGVRAIVGDDESVSRYMGNEMTILLPGYDRQKAFSYAEDLKKKVLAMSFSEVTKGEPFSFTVSIGISVYPDHAAKIPDMISLARELPLISRAHGGGMILFPDHGLAQ